MSQWTDIHKSSVSAVEHYIRYYNNKRIHSAFGRVTPVNKKFYLMWLEVPTEILDHYKTYSLSLSWTKSLSRFCSVSMLFKNSLVSNKSKITQ
jgi:hypothetical protein